MEKSFDHAGFCQTVGIDIVLKRMEPPPYQDLKALCWTCQRSKQTAIARRVEQVIDEYFETLNADTPTLYDHLILSLRPKDVIATFNWDRFCASIVRQQPFCTGTAHSILARKLRAIGFAWSMRKSPREKLLFQMRQAIHAMPTSLSPCRKELQRGWVHSR